MSRPDLVTLTSLVPEAVNLPLPHRFRHHRLGPCSERRRDTVLRLPHQALRVHGRRYRDRRLRPRSDRDRPPAGAPRRGAARRWPTRGGFVDRAARRARLGRRSGCGDPLPLRTRRLGGGVSLGDWPANARSPAIPGPRTWRRSRAVLPARTPRRRRAGPARAARPAPSAAASARRHDLVPPCRGRSRGFAASQRVASASAPASSGATTIPAPAARRSGRAPRRPRQSPACRRHEVDELGRDEVSERSDGPRAARVTRRSPPGSEARRRSAPEDGSARLRAPARGRPIRARSFTGPSPTKAKWILPSTRLAASSTLGRDCAIPCVPANITRKASSGTPSSPRGRRGLLEERLERAVGDQRGARRTLERMRVDVRQKGRVTATTASERR